MTPAALAGHTFLSTAVNGATLAEGTRVTLTFDTATMSAIAGCNTMTGAYSVAGDTLRIPSLAQTAMLCEDELETQDRWLATLLQGSPRVVLDAHDLTLTAGATSIEFGDREEIATASALDGGSWALVELELDGATLAAPDGAYMSFDGDRLYVATGCNRGFSGVTVGDATVTVNGLALTFKACAGDLTTWEAELSAFLSGELRYQLSADRLVLTNTRGTLTARSLG